MIELTVIVYNWRGGDGVDGVATCYCHRSIVTLRRKHIYWMVALLLLFILIFGCHHSFLLFDGLCGLLGRFSILQQLLKVL